MRPHVFCAVCAVVVGVSAVVEAVVGHWPEAFGLTLGAAISAVYASELWGAGK